MNSKPKTKSPSRKPRNQVEKGRRLAHMVRAISTGNTERIERAKGMHGEETYERAMQLWENIDTRQVELRAYCQAVLIDIIDTSEREEVQAKAAVDLLAAIDRANTLRSKFDELEDPEVRRAAIAELRAPTPAALSVLTAAWQQDPPVAIVNLLHSLGWRRSETARPVEGVPTTLDN
jgi:hypothetical protein